MSMSEEELMRLRAKAAEAMDHSMRMVASLEDLANKIKAVSVTAVSRDKLIKVTVGPEGRLVSLELEPDVYEYHTPEQLAQEIEETVKHAAAEAVQRVTAIGSALVPEEQIKAAMAYDYKTVARGLTGEST